MVCQVHLLPADVLMMVGVLDTLSTALTRGSRAGIAAAFGCTLGILPAVPAAVGLAAVRHTSVPWP
jgi:threonine/homoserine/homoserine lactone efflux protein